VPDIVVAAINDDGHYSVCSVKTTIKRVGFLQASIMPIIKNHVLFTIEGKWLEVMMGMPKLLISLFNHIQNKFSF
jgi:hypothetical protein